MKPPVERCPACGADLRGDEIPPEKREHYGGKTRFSRVIAVYDRGRDMTVAWECPDCGHRWERKLITDNPAPDPTPGYPRRKAMKGITDILGSEKAIMDEQKRYSWLQVGTVVDYHAILGGPITKSAMVVREPAQRLPGGQWVCWLRGKAGCVSCDSVTPVAP